MIKQYKYGYISGCPNNNGRYEVLLDDGWRSMPIVRTRIRILD